MTNVLLIGRSITHGISPAMAPKCYYQSNYLISNFSVTILMHPNFGFHPDLSPKCSTLSAPHPRYHKHESSPHSQHYQPSPSRSHTYSQHQPTTTALVSNKPSQSNQHSDEEQSSTHPASHSTQSDTPSPTPHEPLITNRQRRRRAEQARSIEAFL